MHVLHISLCMSVACDLRVLHLIGRDGTYYLYAASAVQTRKVSSVSPSGGIDLAHPVAFVTQFKQTASLRLKDTIRKAMSSSL